MIAEIIINGNVRAVSAEEALKIAFDEVKDKIVVTQYRVEQRNLLNDYFYAYGATGMQKG